MKVALDGSALPIDLLDALHGKPLNVTITDATRNRVAESRTRLDQRAASGVTIYGVNTGFGTLCNKRISPDQLALLQKNLILSHAVGVGPPIPRDLVRWMMLFKVNALLNGASGVQPDCIRCLLEMLDADVIPVVPSKGSLGASGDLAPLAHMVLPMIGRGEVWQNDTAVPAATAFQQHGIKPVQLAAKDGLALINGTQLMLAYLADLVVRGRRLAKHADLFATISLEALRGSLKPFSEALLCLRPHPGALEVGQNVRRLMANSEILLSHANCDKVQDPYSLRCVPQVHGACRDALRHAASVLHTELAAVTDNPVVVGDEVISGGNFHGEPLALVMDYLAIALTEWANISERRTFLLLSGHDGLPPLLLKDTGVNSGLMIPQYTAAALLNECKTLATPASVDSIPTSLGQEDHVSMGAGSALKCRQILDNVESILAIELFTACQALDYRLPTRPGIGPRTAQDVVRRHIPHADVDRMFGEDIHAALRLLRNREVLHGVEAACGPLQ